MKLKTTLVLFLSMSCVLLFGQNYPMNGSDIASCGGFFLDSGGPNLPYSSNEDITVTICPDNTTGTHVQLVFNGIQLGLGDELCFFDGTSINAPDLGCAADFTNSNTFIIQATAPNPTGCLTIVFTSNGIDEGEGWQADINCIPACQLIRADLAHSEPDVSPADTGWIDICPSDEVSLSGMAYFPQDGAVYDQSLNTSTFMWDFGDGTLAEGMEVSHVYEEPGGYVAQLTVTDQFGCKNTNFISQRIRVATHPTFNIGGDLPTEICAGDTISLDALVNELNSDYVVSAEPNEGSFQTEGVRSDSLALPDGDGASYQTNIGFTDFSPGQTLTNLSDLKSICVTMEHSWMRDLEISLTCPDGTTVMLHHHPGQFGGEVFLGDPIDNDGFFPIPGIGYEYCWTPDAANGTWIDYSNANNPNTLPPGDYNSYESLSKFLNCPLNGEWTINVTDLWAIDNGFIFSWSINFDESLYPNLETFTPELVNWNWLQTPSIFFQTSDAIAASPENGGVANYTFTVEDEFGCNFDTMVNLTVLPPTHPNCYNCTELLTPEEDATICAGEELPFDVYAPVEPSTIVPFETYPNYKFNATTHPPVNAYESTLAVSSINPGVIQNLTDILSVCVDISSDYVGYLRLALRAPDGTIMQLSNNNGGSGDNYAQTCFTPSATTPISVAFPPYSGYFKPEGNWNALLGAPSNGDWTLLVSDVAQTNVFSQVNWWSITFKRLNEVTYTWTPSTGLSCNDCPSPMATPVQTTSYNIQAIDSYNCQDQESIEVEVFQGYEAPYLNYEIEPGGIITINWSDVGDNLPYEININNSGWQTPNNGNFSHIASGFMNHDEIDIQVRVKTDIVGCNAEVGETAALYFMCEVQAFASTPPPYYATPCVGDCGGAVPISAVNGTGSFTYNITNLDDGSMSTQNNGSFTGLCAASYQVIVEDSDGCRDTVNFEVIEPPLLTINAWQQMPVSCNGGNNGIAMANASGGLGPITYIWDDPLAQFGNTASSLPAGNYIVTATDSVQCAVTAMVTITEPAPISITTSHTDVLCFGGSDGTATANAMGGLGGFTYQWSDGDTPNQPTTGGLQQGTYTVTATDVNQCTITETVMIGQPLDPIVVDVVQTVTGCFGIANSEAMATPSGGTGIYTYQWMPSGQMTQTAVGLDIITYSVTATDVNGCTATNDINITDLEPIEVGIIVNTPSCPGFSDGLVAVNAVSGGSVDPSFPDCPTCGYLWSDGQMMDVATGLLGEQTYSVTVTDSQGCTGTESILLEDPMPITFDFANTSTSCFGTNDGASQVQNLDGGTTPFMFEWDVNTNSQTTQQASNLLAGNYSVTITDNEGCTAIATTTVEEPQEILVSFDVINNKCPGEEEGEAVINASGGTPSYQFLWSTGSTNQTITNLPVDDYLVTVTDAIGCTTESMVAVSAPDALTANIIANDVTCFGDRDGSITIEPKGGTPPFTYSLDGQDFFGSSTLIGLEEGAYTVFIKDGKGCVHEDGATIDAPEEFTVAIRRGGIELDEFEIDLGDTLQIFSFSDNAAGGNFDAFWTASYCGTLFCEGDTLMSDCDGAITCRNPFTGASNPVFYNLTAVDENGCEAEAMINIRVRKERKVMVPTGFTPNGDGLNEHLLVHGKTGTKINLFRVFDRWGELLYEAREFMVNDPLAGWDGTFKGQDMVTGVYVWYVEVEYEDGMEDAMTGETTLIR